VVTFLSVKADFKVYVVAGERSDFCTVEGKDVVDNRINGFLGKVGIVNAEIIVKPFRLINAPRN